VLLADGVPMGLVTVERSYPVEESEPLGAQFVKIPAGRYRCRRTLFARGAYETYEVADVPGHSRLLFHRGNTEQDSEGCILIGQRFGWLLGSPGVAMSSLGFGEFMKWAAGRESFGLEVKSCAS